MDLIDLEHKIMEAEDAGARVKLIATDGVFSMDGDVSSSAFAAMSGRAGRFKIAAASAACKVYVLYRAVVVVLPSRHAKAATVHTCVRGLAKVWCSPSPRTGFHVHVFFAALPDCACG
jgi:hypothetical protein